MSPRDSDDRSGFLEKPFTRRKLLEGAVLLGAGAALGPVVSACGGSSSSGASASSSAAASAAPKTGGSLRVATQPGSAKDNLDVHAAALTIPALMVRFNMYDALLEFSPTGVPRLALAQEVVPSRDAKQFTVRLKPGLVFHNGKAVTADDVIYSFNRIMNPKNPGLAATQLLGLAAGSYKKLDNLTVRFELNQANAVFPEALAAYSAGIVPVGYNPKGAIGAIGTGPFKIKEFAPGQQIVFTRNTHYWREGPYVDTLSLIPFNDTTAQLNALLGRTVDYVNGVASSQRKVVEGNGFKLLTAKTGSWTPFTMNCDVKPFDDVRVRQAFRLIVDRPQMVEQAYDGMASIGNDIYSPYDLGYPKSLPQRAQDLDQAKSLLKQAGYDNSLTVQLTTSVSVSSNAPSAATVFAQQAKGAGVSVNIRNVTGDVFWGDQYLKYLFSQDIWGTHGYLVQASMGTLPGSVYDETHWKNSKWLSLVKEAFGTVHDAKRNELITEAATIEYNEGAYIIDAFDKLTDAYAANVVGAVPSVIGQAVSACDAQYRTISFA